MKNLASSIIKSNFVGYWLPVLLWMGIIYYFSSQPASVVFFNPVFDLILRKLAHMAEFGILAFLLIRAFGHGFNFGDGFLWFLIIAISFFYAISDEVHQSYVPGRYGSIRDMLIDFNGAFLGIIMWHLYKLRKKKKRK